MSNKILPTSLEATIDALLSEPFAQHYGFNEAPVERIGEILEEADYQFQSEAANDLRDSFDRCKLTYCMLLLEMESHKLEGLMQETLKNLLHHDEPTQSITAAPSPIAIPNFDDDPFEPIQPLMPEIPTQTTIFESPSNAETLPITEIDPVAQMIDALPPPERTVDWGLAPLSDGAPGAPPFPPELPNSAPDSEVIQLETPELINEGTKTNIFEEKYPEMPPVVPLEAEEITKSGIAEIEEVVSPAEEPPTVSLGNEPHVATPEQYRELSDYLENLKHRNEKTLPEIYFNRLIGHSLVCSIEVELANKLHAGIGAFWPNREPAVGNLLDTKNKKFELHPILRAAINQLAAGHEEWLFESKYPHPAVLNSLRYITATAEISKFRPTLLDLSVLMFFFGQEHSLGGFPLKNVLQLKGIAKDRLIEMCMRLLRLHKLRNRTIGVHTDFSPENLKTLREDVERIAALLREDSLGTDDGSVQQVA